MITVFNRRELISTFDMRKQAEIRSILSDNGIEYHVKTINRKSPSPAGAGSRGYTGTYGEKTDMAYEYVIYVKKEDYENASYLTGSVK